MDDTICAIATAIGEGGIGIVRVSGAKAIEIASCAVRVKSAVPLCKLPSHVVQYAELRLGPARRDGGGLFDQGLVVVMRAPRSYTGEDVVELHCHGAPLILDAVCRTLMEAGARLAEPGEFTKRAFLNGKIDLTQAEAVIDMIRAKSEGSLRLAQAHARGTFASRIEAMRQRIIGLLAHLEAGIDFSEEDIEFIRRDELVAGLSDVRAEVTRLVQSWNDGRILREGASVTIVGRPNVGKSSLMNALLASDRAIVTAIPGTTRDVLEESLNLDGLSVRLRDTAGVRTTEDPVEREGIRRTTAAMEEADLVVILLDGSAPLAAEDRELIAGCREKKHLIGMNKCDLPLRLTDDELERLNGEGAVVRISATTGAGLDELKARMRAALMSGEYEPGDSVMIARARHRESLNKAQESIDRAVQSVESNHPGEMIAVDLRAGVEALGEITGAVTTDEILDRIFSDFCIGK